MNYKCFVVTSKFQLWWVKLEFTTETEVKKNLAIYNNMSPYSTYFIAWERPVSNPAEASKYVADKLKDCRIHKNKMWFKMTPEQAIARLDKIFAQDKKGVLS
jgi:hypothetical protein